MLLEEKRLRCHLPCLPTLRKHLNINCYSGYYQQNLHGFGGGWRGKHAPPVYEVQGLAIVSSEQSILHHCANFGAWPESCEILCEYYGQPVDSYFLQGVKHFALKQPTQVYHKMEFKHIGRGGIPKLNLSQPLCYVLSGARNIVVLLTLCLAHTPIPPQYRMKKRDHENNFK